MKYYLDEDISPRVADMLRGYQVDAVSAHEVHLTGVSDREQLEFAALQGRSMVTRNRDDFVRLTVRYFNELRPHYGVLIVPYSIPGDRFRLMARALKKYASKHASGMEPYTIDFLSS